MKATKRQSDTGFLEKDKMDKKDRELLIKENGLRKRDKKTGSIVERENKKNSMRWRANERKGR